MKEICDLFMCTSIYGIKNGTIPKNKVLLFIILLAIPDIIDFILTIINYENNIWYYFLIRFISQVLYIFYCISLLGFLSYKDHGGIDAGYPAVPFGIMFIIMIIFEITSLVLFILKNDNIFLFAKIGYYSHFINIIFNIIIIIMIINN